MKEINKNRIVIGYPRIVCSETTARVEADTVWNFEKQKIEKTLFYEVDQKWKQYLTVELSDSFVLALLELAMEKDCDIQYEAPMSETLKYQLERYLIPVYSRKINVFKSIKLIGPVTNAKIETKGAVGTGFSGGVDSFYSVLSHFKDEYTSKKVTHLLLAVNGAAMTGMTEELDQKWFEEEVKRFEPIVSELGLEFIGINSNISLIIPYKTILKGGDSIVTLSFVHILRKLFGTYYWASTYEADVLSFNDWDGGFMEPFSVPLMNVEGLHFYHSGCEVSRVEKVEYIADYPSVQKALTVCGQPVNCGRCVKCLRTMSELYSIGKLDKFRSVFDVEDYKRHFTTKLARELAIDHPPFTTDIVKSMKKNGIHIPIMVYLKKYLYFMPYYFFKKKLRNNIFLMKLYYGYGLDERLGEGKHSPELIKARFEKKGK